MATGYWVGAPNAVWTTLSNWRTTSTSGTQPASIPNATTDIAGFVNNGIAGQSRTAYMNGNKTVSKIEVTTYNGGITLAGGTSTTPATQNLNITASGIDKSASTTAFTFATTVSVVLTAPNTVLNTGSTGTLDIQGNISGAGFGFDKTGSGTVLFRGTNTFSGTTRLFAGTYAIGDTGGAGSQTGPLAFQNQVVRPEVLFQRSTVSGQLSGVISGTYGYVNYSGNGAGTTANTSFNAQATANTYNGGAAACNVRINPTISDVANTSGVFGYNNEVYFYGSSAQLYLSSAITLNNNKLIFQSGEGWYESSGARLGTLRFGANATVASSVRLENTNAYVGVDSGVTGTISGVIESATGIGLVKIGTGTLVLSNTNTYSGGTTVTSGTLVLNNGSSGDGCVRGSLSATNATIRMDQVWTFGASGNIVTTLTMTNSTLNFNKSGGIGNAYMTWSGTSYTFNDSTFIGLAGTEIYPENGASIVSTGTSSFSSDLTFRLNQASTTINVSSGTFTVASVLGENGTLKGITKSGAGTLALTGANTFTGGTTINAGTVNLGVAQTGSTSGPLGASGTITLGGGTLQYSAANQHDYSPRFSTAASQQYRCDTNGQNVTWGSNLTSSGGLLVKGGSGTLTLLGNNTYTGNSTLGSGAVNVGSIQTGGAGPLGNLTSGRLIMAGGTLQYSSANSFDYSPYFITTLGFVYNVDTNGQSVTWASILPTIGLSGDPGTLNKSGAGTLTLSAANTYSGGTTLSQGTLKAGNASAIGTGPASVASGATLAALASINGKLNIGGTLTNSGGTLRIGGS